MFFKIIFISKTESSTKRPLYVLYAGFRKVRIATSDRMHKSRMNHPVIGQTCAEKIDLSKFLKGWAHVAV